MVRWFVNERETMSGTDIRRILQSKLAQPTETGFYSPNLLFSNLNVSTKDNGNRVLSVSRGEMKSILFELDPSACRHLVKLLID